MDLMGEEQLDYGDDEYGGGQKVQFQAGGAISALADEELMGEDDEYDDLYNDVNVGEGFMQTIQQKNEPQIPFGSERNGDFEDQKIDPCLRVPDNRNNQEISIPRVAVEREVPDVGASFSNPEQKRSNFSSAKVVDDGSGNYIDGVSQKPSASGIAHGSQTENMSYRGVTPMPPRIGNDSTKMPVKNASGASSFPDPCNGVSRNGPPIMANPPSVPATNQSIVNENGGTGRPILDCGPTMIFVGELHWWTTDAELEGVLSRYGRIKEIKFYDERASGKSKGYCHVEFYDAAAAAACKEGMNGHMFNERPCVVAFASAQTMRQMGNSLMNKNQGQGQQQTQGRRIEGVGRGSGNNYQAGDGGRNFGRTGWSRGGGQGGFNRGQNGSLRGRGPVGGRGMVGNNSGVVGGHATGLYGQGLPGSALGGPAGGLMHPQGMMGAAFDPTFMGRGAGYGGFPGPAFPGMMPSFAAVNAVGLPGVAPHVNPAFFGRGVAANGMGMMGATGVEGPQSGMWTDPSMTGWGGSGRDEHGKTMESSYGGDDVASNYGYEEVAHERGGRSNVTREKDRSSERDWSNNSERRHRDERELDRDRAERDRYRDEKDGYRDHRQREREWDNDADWDKGQSSSRSRSKSHIMHEDDNRSRSRDSDYTKRRRITSE